MLGDTAKCWCLIVLCAAACQSFAEAAAQQQTAREARPEAGTTTVAKDADLAKDGKPKPKAANPRRDKILRDEAARKAACKDKGLVSCMRSDPAQ